jgi:excisionase family DNA binding protein
MAVNKEAQAFYTLGEVAELLGLSRMTIYRYVKSRKLHAYKFGTHHRVRKNDLESFISQHKV